MYGRNCSELLVSSDAPGAVASAAAVPATAVPLWAHVHCRLCCSQSCYRRPILGRPSLAALSTAACAVAVHAAAVISAHVSLLCRGRPWRPAASAAARPAVVLLRLLVLRMSHCRRTVHCHSCCGHLCCNRPSAVIPLWPSHQRQSRAAAVLPQLSWCSSSCHSRPSYNRTDAADPAVTGSIMARSHPFATTLVVLAPEATTAGHSSRHINPHPRLARCTPCALSCPLPPLADSAPALAVMTFQHWSTACPCRCASPLVTFRAGMERPI